MCEARLLNGYDVFPCEYLGVRRIACVKGHHTLVIDDCGYDQFVGGDIKVFD